MRLFVFIFLTVIVCSLPVSVLGQTNVPEAQIQTTDKVRARQELEQLETEYFRLLEQYRQQEQTYFVAKNQFLQLNTLAAQEVAIKETKAALDVRAQVLLTYIDILTQMLQQTTGIPLEQKNPQLVNLSLIRDQVLLHQNSVKAASDRVSVDAEADRFIPILTTLTKDVYFTLSLIRIGRVQTAIDKLTVVRNAVGQELDGRNLPSSQQAQKQRGLQEIDRTQQSIEQEFGPIAQATFSRQTESSLQSLTNLSTALTKTFTLIYQNVRFLEEIRL